ncbi:hypothetical protein K1719_047144 [Acacia pycnantha]|nr:hypothetical protein K1719_047144 [Acacia pycnantha]
MGAICLINPEETCLSFDQEALVLHNKIEKSWGQILQCSHYMPILNTEEKHLPAYYIRKETGLSIPIVKCGLENVEEPLCAAILKLHQTTGIVSASKIYEPFANFDHGYQYGLLMTFYLMRRLKSISSVQVLCIEGVVCQRVQGT